MYLCIWLSLGGGETAAWFGDGGRWCGWEKRRRIIGSGDGIDSCGARAPHV